MATKKFVCSLNSESLRNISRQLRNYKNDLETRTYLFAQELAKMGQDVAKAYIVSYDATFTTELYNSINVYETKHTQTEFVFVLQADSDHAIFVEFGTGQRGSENPYPYEMPVNWQYNSGRTIIQLANGEYGWFYPIDENRTQWRFTQGMPSRPFMHDTSVILHENIIKIARKVFA